MSRVGLWMSGAAAAALLAGCGGRSEPQAKEAPVAPAAEAVAQPAAAAVPEPAPVAAPEPPKVDEQVAEDAAAVGMTTREPTDDQAAASEPK